MAPRYAAITAGSDRTSSGEPDSDHLPEVEHDDLIANAHHEVHVVLDHQDGHPPFLGQAAHHPGQFGALGHNPAAGSSRRSTLGCIATARAIASSRRFP